MLINKVYLILFFNIDIFLNSLIIVINIIKPIECYLGLDPFKPILISV